MTTSRPVGFGTRWSSSGLEQSLQALEVLPELLLGPAGHDPGGEAGQHARVAFAGHPQSRPAATRLELVLHAEGDRAVERPERKEPRRLVLLDLERGVHLTAEHVPGLADSTARARLAVELGRV